MRVWVPVCVVLLLLSMPPSWGQTPEENTLFLQVCQTLRDQVFQGKPKDFQFEGIRREGRAQKLIVSVANEWGDFLGRREFAADLKTGKMYKYENVDDEWKSLPVKVDFSVPPPPEDELFPPPPATFVKKKTVARPGLEKDIEPASPEVKSPETTIPEKPVMGYGLPVLYYEYKNLRYHFSLFYPPEIFVPQPEMADGEGQTFLSRDSQAVLAGWGSVAKEGQPLKDILEALKKEYTRTEKEALENDSFLISGTKEERVYHQKTWLIQGMLKSVRFEYPVEHRAFFDLLAEKILKKFSPVD